MFKIILLIIFNIPLFSQWKEIESPIVYTGAQEIHNSNGMISAYGFHDIYFSFDSWKTYNKSNISSVDSIGIIIKCIYYNEKIYILVNDSQAYSGKHGLYVSTDKGNSWNIVDSVLQKRKIIDFEINNNGFHFLTEDVYSFQNNELIYDSYGGYVNYKNNEIKKEVHNYYNTNKKDSMRIYGRSIVLSKGKIIIIDAALTQGSGQFSHKVLVSEDDGDVFIHRSKGLFEELLSTYCVTGDTLIVAKNFINFTTDFGKTWQKNISKQGSVFGQGAFSLTYHKNHIFVSNIQGQVHRSSDLGINWTKIIDNINYSSMSLSSDENYVYFASPWGILLSNDLGETIIDAPIFAKSGNYQLSQYNDILYLISDGRGIFKNLGLNLGWKIFNDSLYKNLFMQSSIYVKDSLILTGYSANGNISYSKNYGKTWNSSKLSGGTTYVSYVFINKERFFALSFNRGINYSDDFGETWLNWNEVNKSLPSLNFTSILNYNDTLFAGTTDSGVKFSIDNGDSWKSISDDDTIKNQRIEHIAKNNNVIIASSNGKSLFKSEDYGKTWKIIENYQNNGSNRKLINYKENFFVYTNDGFYFSTNNGNDWTKNDSGIEQFNNSKNWIFKDLILYDRNIVICFYQGIFTLPLSELGIEYTSIEKTEERNYLYTFPPFPQPTKQVVKISTYWDSALPFTVDDVEIYNLAGIKINIENKLSINKETNYNGHIIWDTSSEQAGIYIVNIKHGTETRTQKVMVEK